MIRILFTLIVLTKLVSAQDLQEKFEQANQFYQQEQFDKSIELYNQILNSGYRSTAVYYNLANSYYKLGEIGKARLFYERALKLDSSDEAIHENLEILKLRLVDQIEAPPRLFLSEWYDLLLNAMSFHTYAWLVLILFVLLLISSAYLVHNKRRGRNKGNRVFVFLLVIWLIVLTLFLHKVYINETQQYAVIMNPNVTVYSEPSQNATEVFIVHEGTKVQVIQESDGWFEIKLIDGKTGWATENSFEII